MEQYECSTSLIYNSPSPSGLGQGYRMLPILEFDVVPEAGILWLGLTDRFSIFPCKFGWRWLEYCGCPYFKCLTPLDHRLGLEL